MFNHKSMKKTQNFIATFGTEKKTWHTKKKLQRRVAPVKSKISKNFDLKRKAN